MQIINTELFTILLPEKGYKLINKNTGSCHKKIYLGVNDSPDNYGEMVDEKYINMDYVVELDNLKQVSNDSIDLLLMTIDEMFSMFEPLLMIVPATIPEDIEPVVSRFVYFYAEMIKRDLKKIEDVPERFRMQVMDLSEK